MLVSCYCCLGAWRLLRGHRWRPRYHARGRDGGCRLRGDLNLARNWLLVEKASSWSESVLSVCRR